MRKLLSISIKVIFVLLLVSCSQTSNKTITKDTINSDIERTDTLVKTNTEYSKGDSISNSSTNTESSEKGSHYKEFEVKHNSPNQTEIDSIKREKSKGKK